jgi:hypothetical protein
MSEEQHVKFEPAELTAVKAAALPLADMNEVDRSYFLSMKAKEIGVADQVLKNAVRAVQNERSQQIMAKRLEEERAAKLKKAAVAEEQRKLDLAAKTKKQEQKDKTQTEKADAVAKKQAEKAAAVAKRQAEKDKKAAAAKAEKEAERKEREKNKSFANILKLPVDRHAGELTKLAKRLSEDIETLRQEFKDFAGVCDGFSMSSDSDVEPWADPVDTDALLQAIDAKISKHIVMQPHQRTAVTLWTAMTWVHNEIATYSPILLATSVNPYSGKSTLLGTVARLVPKPSLTVEANGANVYRFVDAHKPTLILDEADDLFTRKSDLKHIINASWTRGTPIPRQVNISGVSVTVFFHVFCPKAIGLIGGLPRALQSRTIEIRMAPKKNDEKAEIFKHVDDLEFAVLRRQLTRWATDHAAELKNAEPMFPDGMSDRPKMNWTLMLSIAELAGSDWPDLARDAASRLTRSGRRPSDSVQLLAEFKRFADAGKRLITSKDVITELRKDPTSVWSTYNRGGLITERNVAHMLEPYGIYPKTIHPTRRAGFSPKGYVLTSEEFVDAFARYLSKDPHIRTQPRRRRRASPPSRRSRARSENVRMCGL